MLSISTSTTLNVKSMPFVLSPWHFLHLLIVLVSQITAKHINSLIELITSNLDTIHSTDVHPSATTVATSGLIEGINSAETVIKHFKNTLLYIQARKTGLGALDSSNGNTSNGMSNGGGEVNRFEAVEVNGPLLKLK